MSNAPTEHQSALTLENSARASNPGRIQVSKLKWFLNYPKWPLILIGILLFFVMLGLLHWSAWIIATVALVVNLFYWARVSNHFQFGCINPAVIVSTNPLLYAACTDLTHGEGAYPAIRIVQKNFRFVDGATPKVGIRFPTVALYVPSTENIPHWATFDPKPVECATNDRFAIQAKMDSIEKEDWEELDRWLQQVPRPYKPGLYMINLRG